MPYKSHIIVNSMKLLGFMAMKMSIMGLDAKHYTQNTIDTTD